jgi:hypothetical protein
MYQLRADARARAVFAAASPEFDRDPAWEYQAHANLP